MRRIRCLIGGGVLALALLIAPAAQAAFPGRNGMLAAQPATGRGIVLVGANGRGAHRICTARKRCGTPRRPRFSPDGRAIVFSGPAIRIVYTDGSCLDCQFGAAPDPVFEPGGTTISFIQRGRVTVDGIDTLQAAASPVTGASDAVWSATGSLAVVRHGTLWAGPPGSLRRIAPGTDPSWSPRGDRLAAVQHGWVVIVRVRDHHVHRLVRGGAPAFSPDGRWIAFVAPDHLLMVVPSGGGHPRHVGHVRAVSVDWQPQPRGAVLGCAAPPGSYVVASTPAAVVTGDGPGPNPFLPAAYMGCLRADGRERLLERFIANKPPANPYVDTRISTGVLAPPYAALVAHWKDEHYGASGDTVQVFDLRTGDQRKDLGGESALCAGVLCTTLAQLVLGSDGVSAAQTKAIAPPGWGSTQLRAAACTPGSTTCVAAALGGDFFTTVDPAAGLGSWSRGKVAAPQAGLGIVTCPAQSLCVGAGAGIYISSDPADGASTWHPTALNGSAAEGLACPTTTLCVMTTNGTIAATTNPTGGSAAWTSAQIDPANVLLGVACSAEPRCFVTDSRGTVFTSSDPTGGAGAWTRSGATPAFSAGTCPTSTLCVTVGQGTIATTTAPDAAAWSTQSIPDNLFSISCASSSLCVAVGAQGALYVSTNPASGAWSHATIDNGLALSSVSCASAALCVAADLSGHVLSSTDPAGGPSAWTPVLLDGDPCTDGQSCSVESIYASDKTGLHTVDSIELPGFGPFLTGLALNGDTLSWSHNGLPQSVTLTPPASAKLRRAAPVRR